MLIYETAQGEWIYCITLTKIWSLSMKDFQQMTGFINAMNSYLFINIILSYACDVI